MTEVQTTTAVYTVKGGDTLSGIGQRFGLPWQEIAKLNHISDPDFIEIGQKLKLPGHGYKSLVVKAGDNLTKISNALSKNVTKPADKKKLSVNELGRLNNIKNLNLIQVGETIVYPSVPGTP